MKHFKFQSLILGSGGDIEKVHIRVRVVLSVLIISIPNTSYYYLLIVVLVWLKAALRLHAAMAGVGRTRLLTSGILPICHCRHICV